MRKLIFVSLSVCLQVTLSSALSVVQSARDIPVVRECDVLVVGGGSAAVAAALAAKTNGASVLLTAPRGYLGSDIAGTRELWPEVVDESTSLWLAQQLFTLSTPYTYSVDVVPSSSHADPNNTRLRDGVHYNAASHSVEYRDNAQITAAFLGTGTVERLDVYYYVRATSTPFDTEVSAVEYSLDGVTWNPAAISVEKENLGVTVDSFTYVAHITLTGGVQAQYMRIFCDMGEGAERQLLDEIVFHSDISDPVPGYHAATRPFALKQSLQEILLDAEIPYVTGSPVCDVLRDGADNPAGVVLANRKGRQAVKARVVIDATDDSWLTQRAGGVKRSFVSGSYSFSRIVMADLTNAPSASDLTVEMLPGIFYDGISVTGVNAPAGMPSTVNGRVYRCSFTTNLIDGGILELLEVEQTLRDLTWVKTCVDEADVMSWLPPDSIICAATESTTLWQSAAALNLDAFRPAGVNNFYVAGLRADVTRELAEAMRNPARMMAIGEQIGAAAAAEALARPLLTNVALPGDSGLTVLSEDVRELLDGLPPVNTNAQGFVAEEISSVPILASCEVLVVGAGTAGAPAAIAAGRAGAETLVIDFLYSMGGVQTDGRIGRYYHGNVCGFTQNEIDPGVAAMGSVLVTSKSEWYRQSCRAAGVRILYGTMAVGALVDNDDLTGVVVVLPDGRRGVIRADAVVDATGNALVAAVAGAETTFITADEVAVQGAGQARHLLGNSYNNTDVGFVDERDAADLLFFAQRALASIASGATWDIGQNPASRERQRLVGVVTVDPVDILNNRTWPDTVVQPRSDFDSHGFTVHDLFFIRDPGTAVDTANLPYRALLPKTLDGLLVTGLGISAHRDAMPTLRMQPDVQNQGYAAGYAVALAVQAGVTPRNVDITALQSHLVAKGILDPANAGTPDSFPLAYSAIQAAVDGLVDNYATLHTVLADVDTALPMLRAAYAAQSDPAEQLIYAHVLGLLYDPTGAATLAAAVEDDLWITGWDYRGMGQYGRSVTMLDSYIIALGRTLSPVGILPVLEKTAQLSSDSSFSHIRAVAFALEALDGGSAILTLSSLLNDLQGFALTNSLTPPIIPGYSNTAGDLERNNSLKELAVARALFNMGDDSAGNGARVLADYAVDPREVYADHARQVLDGESQRLNNDGLWSATAPSSEWCNAANWQNGVQAGGMGATAIFTNALPHVQSISLNSGLVNIGSLIFGGSDRIIVDGILDIAAQPPVVDVAAETHATIESEVLSSTPLIKSGAGTLAMAGVATLGGVDLREGRLTLSDPHAVFHCAYAANTLDYTSSSAQSVTLRCDFSVNSEIMITALGAYDSDGDGFESYKKAAIYNVGDDAPLAALGFVPDEEYALESGHRFRQLPEPLVLTPGDYSIVTYGFSDADRYIVGSAGTIGERVGTVESGGVLSFLTNAFQSTGGVLSYPTAPIGPASDYAVSAGSFHFVTGAHPKKIITPVRVAADATLDVAAVKMIFEQGLIPGANGLGVVSNASAAHPVSLSLGVPAGTTNTMAGSAINNRSDGPLTLVKTGEGALELTDELGFDGGIHIKSGLLTVDSPASLGVNDLSFDTGGRLRLQHGGTLGKTLHTPSQRYGAVRSTRLEIAGGEQLIFTGCIQSVHVDRFNGFVIQPFDNGVGLTRVVMDGAVLGYIDLYLLGDGANGIGAAEHEWINVSGALRKLTAGDETTTGSRFTLGSGCDISTGWFDICGSNAVITITDGADISVKHHLRFDHGHSSQLVLDGGTLHVGTFGWESIIRQNLALKPVLFNGTWIKANADNDTFFNLASDSAAPLIKNRGALFDTEGYDVALRGRGFAQAPGSSGEFVKAGAGTLRVATPMSYTGLTVVSNGVLMLDFALWQNSGDDAGNLLPSLNSVWCADGTTLRVAGVTNAAGELTQCQSLANLTGESGGLIEIDVDQAALQVCELDGSFVKAGAGKLALIGESEGTTRVNGSLHVRAGTFELLETVEAFAISIPYASFETDPLLSGGTGDRDRRGTAATADCPGWTFVSNDAGYQRNLSYFSAIDTCFAPDGEQTAFVRRNGSINTTLQILTNGSYTLTFQYCPRFDNNTWYDQHVLRCELDGEIVDSVSVTNRFFAQRTVELGKLVPGSYTLSFNGDGSQAKDPCTLIDLVTVSGTAELQGVQTLSNENWHLSVDSPGQIALNYSGLVTIGSLTVDGQPYDGVYVDSTTHPGLVSGNGILRINQAGLILILR